MLYFYNNKKLNTTDKKLFTFPYLIGQNNLTAINFIIKGDSKVTLSLRDENTDKMFAQVNCEKSQLNSDMEKNFNIFSMLDFGDFRLN